MMRDHCKNFISYKMVICGNVVETYHYEIPIAKGLFHTKGGRHNAIYTDSQTKADNRKKIAYRARKRVRDFANCNASELTKFVTLTFAENLTDLSVARMCFKLFIKKISYRYKDFKYIAVPEFQKRGAVHFHLLCNLPYVDVNELAKVWGYGFIKLNKIDNVDNVGAYITKYMQKDNFDNRLIGRKSYYMSKNLQKPVIITNETEIEDILCENETTILRTRNNSYYSDYNGSIEYTQYIFSKPITAKRKPDFGLLEKVKTICRIERQPLSSICSKKGLTT